MVTFWEAAVTLKAAAIGCALLAAVELLNSSLLRSRKPALFSLVDIAYLISSTGSFAAFATELYHSISVNIRWAAWTPKQYIDLSFTVALCIAIVFISAVFIVGRLRGYGAPGIVCASHGILLTLMTATLLHNVESECRYELSTDDIHYYTYPARGVLGPACTALLTLGSFLTSGFADMPTSAESKTKAERRRSRDSCSPFSRVFLTDFLIFLKNVIRKSRVIVRDIPRLKLRLRCNSDSEKESMDLIKKANRISSHYRFLWLVIRHGWKEHFWSNATSLLYYSSMMIRIPLFHGLLGDSEDLPFRDCALLLLASCAAECLLASVYSYSANCIQLRAQLLLQTAVFKKVTRLSAAATASNPAGQVCSLLVSDAWTVAVACIYLTNGAVGLLFAAVAMAALGAEIGYVPACACLLWLTVVVVACFSVEPLVDKCCKVLYKRRDERLRKFTDFLSSIRTIKMAAMENVFKTRLLQLRMKEINQAYRVNVVDSVIETIVTTSSSMMTIVAFGVASLTSPGIALTPGVLYAAAYALSIMDALTATIPYVLRFKSPAFRSSKRLMSYFSEEEYCNGNTENHAHPEVSVGGIAMEECSFAWAKRDSQTPTPVLTHVNLRLKSGCLAAIVGRVGSGKSSLLSAIAGDMRRLSGSQTVSGSIAVVPQAPRVLNMSIRDNITFGRKFDKPYYDEVLKACQLLQDINRLPSGDLTEAGDKGEMLSGGQRQRVALARAVYTRSNIYLLDDPTSSQDSRVARSIVQQVFGEAGIISAKTRLLATSNMLLPSSVDRWVLMDKNTATCFKDIKEFGSFPGAPTELFEENKYASVQQATNQPRETDQDFTEPCDTFKVVEEESTSSQKGILQVAVAYFRYSGVCSPLAFLCFASSAILVVGQLILFRQWASMATPENGAALHLSGDITRWLLLVCIGDVIFRLSAGVLLAWATWRRSLRLHAVMLERIAASPLSFFDSSPRGRIFNRFSVDLETNDSRVFLSYKQIFQNVFYVLGRLALIATQTHIVFGLACCTIAILLFVMRHFLRATMMGRVYESTRASLLLQHLTETLECVGLVRCYNVTERFCARFRRLMTSYLGAYNVFSMSLGLASLLISFCGQIIIMLTTAIVVVPADGNPTLAADVGLALLSSITVSFAMAGVFQAVTWTVQGDVAFKRALEYTDIPPEEETKSRDHCSSRPSYFGSPGLYTMTSESGWPSRGEVIFEHYSASYRPGITENTLKDISLAARPGEKVAIVGRTGAGKSSLVLALLRMIERTSGIITIDGVDISTVSLKRLRTAVSVIPQDSSLFRGTLRENLDPEDSHSDADLYAVIRSVHLNDLVDGSPVGISFAVSEKGANLSAGQRQLVALARALLRKTKVLVLDEATSQMDPDTERKVQATLRQSFSHCTVITIAHRLDTIMDYDRVVVMGEGRVLECGLPIDLLADGSSTFRSMALSAGIDPEVRKRNTAANHIS